LKIPARGTEYSLTENVTPPFQAEPTQDKYPEHKAPNPFFDVVMKGLNGLVDGEH